MSEKQEAPKWLGGYQVKLKNRRVRVDVCETGEFILTFRKLKEDGTIKRTELKLTEDAMCAVMTCVAALAKDHGPLGSICNPQDSQ